MTVGQAYGVSAFERDLLRFGPDFARWPDPARGRGAALAAADPEARALLEDMQVVSALFIPSNLTNIVVFGLLFVYLVLRGTGALRAMPTPATRS